MRTRVGGAGTRDLTPYVSDPEERDHFTSGYRDHVWARDKRYVMFSRNDGSEPRLYDAQSDPHPRGTGPRATPTRWGGCSRTTCSRTREARCLPSDPQLAARFRHNAALFLTSEQPRTLFARLGELDS